MLIFLTETKKIILKGIIITTAIMLVTFGGYKLFKKSPQENIGNGTSINESTDVGKIPSGECSNNKASKTLEVDENKMDVVGLVPKVVDNEANEVKMDTTPSSSESNLSKYSSTGNSSYTESSQNNGISHDSERIKEAPIEKYSWANLFPEEADLRCKSEKIKETFIKRDGVTYVKTRDGKEVKAGTFYEYSVGQLKEALEDEKKVGGGKISAIGIKEGANLEFVDVSCLQADPQYANNTVFVLASNFNALETLSSGDDIDSKYLSSYASDNTQGPMASISAPATTFYRQYGIFRNEENEDKPFEWKQRNRGFVTKQGLKPKQINLLEDLGINTKNGYVVDKSQNVYDKLFGEFKDKAQGYQHFVLPQGITLDQLPNNEQEAYDKFKIAYFSDCQVVYNNNAEGTLDKFFDENQCVDQVCVAALALNYKGSDMRVANTRDCESAKRVIKAQYEAIFRAAALHGKKNVVIPIVGGGVFNNDPQWTVDALNELKDIIQDYGLNVIVNTFRSDKMGAMVKNNLIKLIKETRGTFNEYNGGSPKPVNIAKTHHR